MENLKIIKETKNNLFNRLEVEAVLSKEVTPSNAEVLALLGKKFGVSEEVIKVLGIYGRFGTREVKISACIYKSKEEKNKLEKKKKKELKEKKKLEEEEFNKAKEKIKNNKQEEIKLES